jgi:thiosulfate/3-mercaptopyruvate sulfurtransferase
MNPYEDILGLNSRAPWVTEGREVVKEEGTFTSADAQRALSAGQRASLDRETTAFRRIGERSRHTWFVLKYLFAVPKV